MDQFQQSLMETEFKAEIVEKLAQFAGRSTTLVDCFARIMAWLFGPQGLVLVDSGDPNLRCIERPMFEQFIAWSREMNEALWNGKRKVESLGYAAQLDLKEGSANLFVDHDGERTLLYRDEYGGFTDKKGHVRFTKQELVDLAKTTPSGSATMRRPVPSCKNTCSRWSARSWDRGKLPIGDCSGKRFNCLK